MPHTPWKKAAQATGATALAALLLLGAEVLLAIPGPDDHFHNPSPDPVRLGGPAHLGGPLVYAVLGDSTAAGRGGHYDSGIAMQTARHLAQTRPIVLVNLAVSGAKVRDVLRCQLPAAVRLRPNIVLLAVGANDATHFTSGGGVRAGLTAILEALAAARPGVRVVLTGSPDMGACRRFAQPLRWVAGLESVRINRVVDAVLRDAQARGEHVALAPIYAATGPLFRRDPGLFAPDRFHPNDRGYATWLPPLDAALDGVGVPPPARRGSPVPSPALADPEG